jgi:hypothetical protein
VGEAAATCLPIEARVTEACDAGVPLVLATPDAVSAALLDDAAARLATDIARLQRPASAAAAPSVRFDPKRGLVMRVLAGEDEGREFLIPRGAVAALPGAPPGASATSLDAVRVVDTAGPGGATVQIRWQEGAVTSLTYDEFKGLASADADARGAS